MIPFARLSLLFVLTLAPLGASASSARGAQPEAAVAGLTAAEALRVGEAMYLKGMLPSGQPMRAVVQGDIEVTGEMTTCSSCHMRSGMGSMEGGILTPPTSGSKLFAPLTRAQDIPGPLMNKSMFKGPFRPAYTEASLANAIRYGADPTGRTLKETMPRYHLSDEDSDILVYYLKHLSATISPGADAETVRFATIVTDRVGQEKRDALLRPLKVFLDEEWNNRVLVLAAQWNARWYGADGGKGGEPPKLRRAVLDVWELTGPESGWGEQLARLYAKKPVFAILGGVSPGSWEPVHRFCEENRIPAVFPTTELPALTGSDWYTLYFSKGLAQEGESAAMYLSRVFELPQDKKVVQVYRDDDRGRALARGFAERWRQLGKAELVERRLAPGEKVGAGVLRRLAEEHPGAALVLWLPAADLAGLEELAELPGRPSTLFFSASQLGDRLWKLPEPLRDFSFITYPFRLPGDDAYSRSLLTNWMKLKKIPESDLAVTSDVYFFTRLLSRAFLDMGVDLYRDFFIDLLDCSPDQTNSSLRFPRLSFGPGQRYASKGCYVVTVGKGDQPTLVKKSDWVIY